MVEKYSYTQELTQDLTREQLVALVDWLSMRGGLYNEVKLWCEEEKEFED